MRFCHLSRPAGRPADLAALNERRRHRRYPGSPCGGPSRRRCVAHGCVLGRALAQGEEVLLALRITPSAGKPTWSRKWRPSMTSTRPGRLSSERGGRWRAREGDEAAGYPALRERAAAAGSERAAAVPRRDTDRDRLQRARSERIAVGGIGEAREVEQSGRRHCGLASGARGCARHRASPRRAPDRGGTRGDLGRGRSSMRPLLLKWCGDRRSVLHGGRSRRSFSARRFNSRRDIRLQPIARELQQGLIWKCSDLIRQCAKRSSVSLPAMSGGSEGGSRG